MMKSIIKPTLILSLIAFAAGFALSHINRITKERIEEIARRKKEDALLAVLPTRLGYVIIEKEKKTVVDGREFVFSVGEKSDGEMKKRAYAFVVSMPGYSGIVKSLVGIDDTGRIIGISIIQQTETPGLGARAKEVASAETFFGRFFGGDAAGDITHAPENQQSWFESQFAGLDAYKTIAINKKGEWRQENAPLRQELLEANAVSAITGATVTTRAVVDGIGNAMVEIKKIIERERAASAQEVDAK